MLRMDATKEQIAEAVQKHMVKKETMPILKIVERGPTIRSKCRLSAVNQLLATLFS